MKLRPLIISFTTNNPIVWFKLISISESSSLLFPVINNKRGS